MFSTDQYLPDSVKSMERQRRGTGEKLILNGEATKKPPDWKSFLSNDENKAQFIRLMLKMWKRDEYASNLQARQVIFICDGQATLLTSNDGLTTESRDLPLLKRKLIQESSSTLIMPGVRITDICSYKEPRLRYLLHSAALCCTPWIPHHLI